MFVIFLNDFGLRSLEDFSDKYTDKVEWYLTNGSDQKNQNDKSSCSNTGVEL